MQKNQLMQIAEKSGLPQPKAKALLEIFQQFFEVVEKWEVRAFEIVVTDETQTDIMAEAERVWKIVQRARINVEDNRIEQKRQSLMEGKAVDGMANILKLAIKPIEDHLYAQKNFVKIREEALRKEREAKALKLLQEQEEKERLKKERQAEQERRDNIKMQKIIEAQNKQLKKQETVIEKQAVEIKETETLANEQMKENLDLRKANLTVICPKCKHKFLHAPELD
jgi:hypothetical protein